MHGNQHRYQKIFFGLFIIIIFIILSSINFVRPVNRSYSLFLEFDNAYGLKEGTPVTYKGVKVGSVNRISLSMNKVVVLVIIKSANVLIPSNVVFEANQIGLFNDIVISINLIHKPYYLKSDFMYLSQYFHNHSNLIQPNSYIRGYKGLNYDDLIRSTTRISQRFDDPRFFSLLYLFLKNSLYISDELLVFICHISLMYKILMHQILFSWSRHIL